MSKIAIVTASSTGIGLSIVEKLSKDNYYCIINSRNIDNITKAISYLKSKDINCEGYVCDVNNKNDRINLLNHIKSKFNRLDILVLNAAVNKNYGSILTISEEHFDQIYKTNLKSQFYMVIEYLELMKNTENDNKSIIFISSTSGYEYSKLIPIYSIFKAALTPLVKLLSAEIDDFGIRVNGIVPGLIKTKFSKVLWENIDKLDDNIKLGSVDDIANLIQFLISDKSRFINGTMIAIAGKGILGL